MLDIKDAIVIKSLVWGLGNIPVQNKLIIAGLQQIVE